MAEHSAKADGDARQEGRVSPPRMQTLSDLIFGLALSIGAIALLSSKPTDVRGLAESVIGFGWSFLMLALIWVRYTRVMSVLPVETGRLIASNMLLLFLVSIEPYLYNLIVGSFSVTPGQLDPGSATAAYALDMGSIFVVIAYFLHLLTDEERNLIPRDQLRRFRLMRNATVVSAALFLVSVLPVFWDTQISGVQVRLFLWIGTFVTWGVRRGFERRSSTA